jgi:hypothetical protein
MRCSRVRKQLLDWVEAGLSGRQGAAIAAHLEKCAPCRAEAEELRQAELALRTLASLEAAPDLTADLHRRLAAPPARSFPRRWAGAGLGAAAALAALALWLAVAPQPASRPIQIAGHKHISSDRSRSPAVAQALACVPSPTAPLAPRREVTPKRIAPLGRSLPPANAAPASASVSRPPAPEPAQEGEMMPVFAAGETETRLAPLGRSLPPANAAPASACVSRPPAPEPAEEERMPVFAGGETETRLASLGRSLLALSGAEGPPAKAAGGEMEAAPPGLILLLGPPQPQLPSSSYEAEVSLPDGARSVVEQTIERDEAGDPCAIRIACRNIAPEDQTGSKGG